MTPEELKQKLLELGINPEEAAWKKSKPTNLGSLPLIQKQREALTKVKEMLQAQVNADQAQILASYEQLARLKRGGGQ